MSKKEKQKVDMSSFAPAGAYDEDTTNYNDMSYWESFNTTNVAPVSEEQKSAAEDRQKKIEKLYPTFTHKRIPLEQLTPAKAEWNFFPIQKNGVLEELMKNIVAYGQLSPALVWQQEDGSYMILGGHTRYQALKELHEICQNGGDEEQADRFNSMDCNVYSFDELDDLEARKIIIYDNVIRRENTTAIKAQAVINMNMLERDSRGKRQQNKTRERILTRVANALGEPEGTVKDLYRLRTLIPEFWQLVDAEGENKITVQYARVVSVLSPALQKYIYEKKLFNKKLTGSQMGLLKKAKEKKDVDAVYSEPVKYTASVKVELEEPLPSNYKMIALPVSNKEYDIAKRAIIDMLYEREDISEKTKELLISSL